MEHVHRRSWPAHAIAGCLIALTFVALPAGVMAADRLQSMTVNGGQVVYDPADGVYWLADANFAANKEGRKIWQAAGISGINENGSMSYATALLWVKALNQQNFLGHRDWQLPLTPLHDKSCGSLGPGGASFGGLCQGNALGSLYYLALGLEYPANAASYPGANIGSLQHLQLAYYWTQTLGGVNGTGRQVSSINSRQGDVTEVNDVFYYALAMVPAKYGPIHDKPPSCSISPVEMYASGPAANLAIYDCKTGISWLADANYAATNNLGFTGSLDKPIYFRRRGISLPAPKIDHGAMTYDITNQWVAKLAATNYAGSINWQLPDSPSELQALYADLQMAVGDGRLLRAGATGPFQNLQPFFYWETCSLSEGDTGPGVADCASGNAPAGKRGGLMNFDFTFGYGLLSTDLSSLNNFVMVNYPAGSPRPSPLPPRQPANRFCPPGLKCPKPM